MRSMTKIFISVLCLVMLFTASGCRFKTGTGSDEVKDKTLSVYTSFYTMYDFAKKIGGEKIGLSNLVPAGTEPHDWEPSPKDLKNLEKANVLIYNGAGMEAWVEKILNSLNNKNLVVVEASKGLQLLKNEHEGEEMEFDPHVWLNPMLAKKQMAVIKDALSAADPGNRDYFEKNFEENSMRLDQLDKEYKETLGKFKRKDIVVSHEAFGYLCDAYNLKQVAIEGLSADSEPTPARMAEIIKFVRDNKVKVIFFEELVSPKVAEAIAKETGAGTERLNPMEGLHEDDIKAGKEYFTVMKENLAALTKALE